MRAFLEEAALPVTEVGPVDFWALRRLASIWRRVDMFGCGWTGREACPTLTIKRVFLTIRGERLEVVGNEGLRFWMFV